MWTRIWWFVKIDDSVLEILLNWSFEGSRASRDGCVVCAKDIHLVIVFEKEWPICSIDFGVGVLGSDDMFMELNLLFFHLDFDVLLFLLRFISLHRCWINIKDYIIDLNKVITSFSFFLLSLFLLFFLIVILWSLYLLLDLLQSVHCHLCCCGHTCCELKCSTSECDFTSSAFPYSGSDPLHSSL